MYHQEDHIERENYEELEEAEEEINRSDKYTETLEEAGETVDSESRELDGNDHNARREQMVEYEEKKEANDVKIRG